MSLLPYFSNLEDAIRRSQFVMFPSHFTSSWLSNSGEKGRQKRYQNKTIVSQVLSLFDDALARVLKACFGGLGYLLIQDLVNETAL